MLYLNTLTMPASLLAVPSQERAVPSLGDSVQAVRLAVDEGSLGDLDRLLRGIWRCGVHFDDAEEIKLVSEALGIVPAGMVVGCAIVGGKVRVPVHGYTEPLGKNLVLVLF